MINITDKAQQEKICPLFRLGFRPFFLFGCAYGAFAVAVWVWMFQSGNTQTLSVPPLWWHVHEMFFGFAMAIVAGFLLTAVQNWTGQTGTQSTRLFVIFALWLAPRILLWTPAPLWLTSSIEALFLALVAYEIFWRAWYGKNYKNLWFAPFLLMAALVNFASYATIKGLPPFSSSAVWQAMIWWFALLLSVMGGRVIPFFTARRYQLDTPKPLFILDLACHLSLFALLVLSFFSLSYNELQSPLMIFAGVCQLIRMVRWRGWISLKEPLVWSLHLSYLCLPASLLFRGVFGVSGESHAFIHLFVIGALAGLILAMVARVSLGHTGRNIYQGPNMAWAFGLLILGAMVRSVGVAFWPAEIILLINVSAILWVLAFAVFIWFYFPILTKPRVDGHPG